MDQANYRLLGVAGASSGGGPSDMSGIERALLELAATIKLKNVDIEVINEVPKVMPPAVTVNPVTVTPSVTVENKVEPAAVVIRGNSPKVILLAAAMPTAAVLVDIAVRIFLR